MSNRSLVGYIDSPEVKLHRCVLAIREIPSKKQNKSEQTKKRKPND